MSNGLSLAFIEQKPIAAARALNALPVADAADYLESIPTRFAVRVLARIGAWPASRLIGAVSPTSGAAMLRSLPYLDSVAILRLMNSDDRRALLKQCPRRLRRDFESTMSYPTETVGGQMHIGIVALEQAHTIADAQEAVRAAVGVETDQVFVTDDDRNYLGSVSLCELLRQPADALLGNVMATDLPSLLARQTLLSAAPLEGWRRSHHLPVLGRQGHLIGSLSVIQLHAALTAGSGDSSVEASVGPVSALLAAYVGTANDLISTLRGSRS